MYASAFFSHRPKLEEHDQIQTTYPGRTILDLHPVESRQQSVCGSKRSMVSPLAMNGSINIFSKINYQVATSTTFTLSKTAP